uniref:START domain-containing protein n=1 Tax=Rhizophora mucronata TaxID=61149 RepID=A0A2P2KYK0_RHIMU
MALWSVLLEILHRPTIGDVVGDIFNFVAPLWIALIVGILVGWAWKPKWASYSGRQPLDCSASPTTVVKTVASPTSCTIPTLNFLKLQLPSCIPWIADDSTQNGSFSHPPAASDAHADCSPLQSEMEKSKLVAEDDLQHLYKLVNEKDGGPPWIQMMDRSTPTMSYQAWRRDCENGPPQYRSRTVFEEATPEMVRDFFWDDDFRVKWDDMLIYAATLEKCLNAGTMVVQWVRKFPFFCSDREYIIARRIWESGRTYYCVTKV